MVEAKCGHFTWTSSSLTKGYEVLELYQMSNFFRRVWQVISRPTRYVGRDLEGNKFYEYPSTSEDPRRTKRMIKYQPESRKWDYVSGQARLPVQWSMWLSHTRHDAPSLEELQTDLMRQRRVQASALELEAQYDAERAAQKLVPEPAPRQTPESPIKTESAPVQPSPPQRERMKMPPSAPPPETQAWSPDRKSVV